MKADYGSKQVKLSDSDSVVDNTDNGSRSTQIEPCITREGGIDKNESTLVGLFAKSR